MPVKATVSPGLFLFWAAALLLLPIRFLFWSAVAAGVHELFHYIALKVFRLQVYEIRLTPLGAVMETEPVSGIQGVICTLAGPVGSLLLLFVKNAPLLGFCGLMQGLFNLIPVYPFDGGRALLNLLEMCCPRWGRNIFSLIEGVFLAAAAVLGIQWGMTWAVMTWIGWVLLRKIPCKDAALGVQ